MGNAETKVDFRKAVLDLTSKNQKLDDATFWNQFWPSATSSLAKDVFNMIPQADIRALRENSPNNLATLCFKSVDTLRKARDAMCPAADHKKVINCLRLLTRIIPFMLEDAEWRSYFWTALPTENKEDASIPVAAALLSALSDLLFCPNFTIASPNNTIESLASLDSCECIWQAGVGFANKTPLNATFDANRTEILKLLLTVFSEVIYAPLTAENRHVLPLFTSLLNVVCSYDPVGYGLPYNYLLVNDSREPLVQAAIQTINGHQVFAQYIEKDAAELPSLPGEHWLTEHVRQSRYTLQIRKCGKDWCCGGYRCAKLPNFLPSFLPAPIPCVFDARRPRVAEEGDEKPEFGDLADRLALSSCFSEPICFDQYCPTMKDKYEKMMCKHCRLYMSSVKRKNAHEKACQEFEMDFMDFQDPEETVIQDEVDFAEEMRQVRALQENYQELEMENLKYEP